MCLPRPNLPHPTPPPFLPCKVGDGFFDFFPSPVETRQLIGTRYAVTSTCLVQFSNDSTDETPELEALLRSDQSSPGGAASSSWSSSNSGVGPGGVAGTGRAADGAPRDVTRLLLQGSHITPCGGDAGWRVPPGRPFTPVDALAAVANQALRSENQRLGNRLVAWLDAHS